MHAQCDCGTGLFYDAETWKATFFVIRFLLLLGTRQRRDLLLHKCWNKPGEKVVTIRMTFRRCG